jgi:hypothetical protein
MRKIAETIAEVNEHSHTFSLHLPGANEGFEFAAWASAALKTWVDQSPWRAE